MYFKSLKTRLIIITTLCIFPTLVIIAKLFYIQVLHHNKYKNISERAVEIVVKTQKRRGTIYDRNSVILTKSLPTYSCAVSKRYVNHPRKLITTLCEVLNIETAKIEQLWSESGNFFYAAKKITPSQAKQIGKILKERNITGAVFTLENTRFYPNEDLAIDLLGAVNSKNKGVSGLEFLYENILNEESQPHSKAIKDRYGHLIYDVDFRKKSEPLNIHLTIDSRMQYLAEQAIDEAVKKHGAESGFIIVQNPHTGEILASSSHPRISGKAYLFQWTYEPGSTFKIITAAAGLDVGKIKITDTFDCENGSWDFSPSVTIGDHEKHGILDVSEIIEVSSNIGAGKIALKIGAENMHKYIKAFGFASKTAIGYPGQSTGVLRPMRKWRTLDVAVMGFGHAISVTGIQLINAVSVIANGGKLLQPQILKEIVDSDGKIKYKAAPRLIRRVISDETAGEINKMMQTVVETGTAMSAYIKGYTIAGKTGTSRKIDESGEYTKEKHVSSFCGFLPALDPKFTILVVIDQPQTSSYGGVTAAPVFRNMAKKLLALYGVKPDAAGKKRPKPKDI